MDQQQEKDIEGISNIYSTHEVTLLNWLNYHFEKEGKRLYGKSK